MNPAPSATNKAPAIPSAMPPATKSPRRGTPRVAAQTIEMISAASSTSRKTNSATPGMRVTPRSAGLEPYRGENRRRIRKCPACKGPTKTTMLRCGNTTVSRLKSVLSNSSGVVVFVRDPDLELGFGGNFECIRVIDMVLDHQRELG